MRRSTRLLMRETMFDDSYNIREVLDDVIERVTLREKLISTAKQFAEKGVKLDSGQMQLLTHSCRRAKEELLAALEAAPGFRPAQKLLLELSTTAKN